MNLGEIAHKYRNKRIHAKMTDGEIFEGKVVSYCSAEDNEPAPEGIIIETSSGALIELYINEIENITA